jgi:hypothetical protein
MKMSHLKLEDCGGFNKMKRERISSERNSMSKHREVGTEHLIFRTRITESVRHSQKQL